MSPTSSNGPDRLYTSYEDNDNHIRVLVADIVRSNPGLFKGYLVVAVNIDDSMEIAHNTCCLPHMVNHLIDAIKQYPELGMSRRDGGHGHGL